MPKYIVSGTVTISCWTSVEADSPEQAKEIAAQRPPCGLNDPRMGGNDEKECWFHSGEMDGIPEPSSVELA